MIRNMHLCISVQLQSHLMDLLLFCFVFQNSHSSDLLLYHPQLLQKNVQKWNTHFQSSFERWRNSDGVVEDGNERYSNIFKSPFLVRKSSINNNNSSVCVCVSCLAFTCNSKQTWPQASLTLILHLSHFWQFWSSPPKKQHSPNFLANSCPSLRQDTLIPRRTPLNLFQPIHSDSSRIQKTN